MSKTSALPRVKTQVAPTIVFAQLGGLAGVGAGGVLDIGMLTAGSVMVATAVTMGAIAHHRRVRRHAEATDRFTVAVSSTLGWRTPTRDCVEVKRWSRAPLADYFNVRKWPSIWKAGRETYPVKLVLYYQEAIDDFRPDWATEIRDHAQRRLGHTYAIVDHHARKTRIVLEERIIEAGSKDFQIDRVNTIVSKVFGVGCKVTHTFTDEGLRNFTVRYEVNPRLSSPQLRHRVETSVTGPLKGRWRAIWNLEEDCVRFEVRPYLDELIETPAVAPETVDPLATYDKLAVPYAVDEDGHVISWRPKKDPHMLVTGKTGKGKTVVLLGIVTYLAAMGWKIWGIDGKRIEFLGLRDYPNVELIAGRVDHQARVAHQVFEMMQRRTEEIEAGNKRLEDFEPVLFVIDEYKTFRNAVGRWYRSVKPRPGGLAQPPVLDEISDFVSLARKVRMHLLLGLQRPDAEFLTGDMRENFNCRISLGRLSPDAAKMMFDSYSIGVAVPVNAIGRGTTYNADGEAVEVQAYWTPDPYQTDPEKPEIWVTPNDLHIVERIRPKVTLHHLKKIIDPDDWADLDGDSGGNKAGPDYNEYMATRIISASEAAARPVRKAAGIFDGKRTAELTKLQIESEEPTIDDSNIFEGYDRADTVPLSELMDCETHRGAIVMVDPDNEIWGLVESIEPDLEEDYVAIDFRNLSDGEPGSISLPESDAVTLRRPLKIDA